MADYDVNKGTKLGHLKSLAEKVKGIKTELSELKDTTDSLVAAGGEANTIEKIKVNGLEQSIEPSDKSVDIKVPTKVSDLTDKDDYATKAEIDAKISSVYKPGGSVKFEALPGAGADNLGKVYNVEDAFDIDDRFVENANGHYPAGTNVVVVDAASGDYKYDVLAGFVDLTDYAKTDEVVKKDGNKQLSTEDYTTADKQKLAGLENYTEATGSKAGLMSATDKTKLDGIDFATDEEVQGMLNEVFVEE